MARKGSPKDAVNPEIDVEALANDIYNDATPKNDDGSVAAEAMIDEDTAKAAGALSADAVQRNRDQARVIDAKRKGGKNIAWGTKSAVELFGMVRAVYGIDGGTMRVERMLPSHVEFPSLKISQFNTGDELYNYILEHCHKRQVTSKYKISFLSTSGSANLMRGVGEITMPDTTEGKDMNQPPPWGPYAYPPPGYGAYPPPGGGYPPGYGGIPIGGIPIPPQQRPNGFTPSPFTQPQSPYPPPREGAGIYEQPPSMPPHQPPQQQQPAPVAQAPQPQQQQGFYAYPPPGYVYPPPQAAPPAPPNPYIDAQTQAILGTMQALQESLREKDAQILALVRERSAPAPVQQPVPVQQQQPYGMQPSLQQQPQYGQPQQPMQQPQRMNAYGQPQAPQAQGPYGYPQAPPPPVPQAAAPNPVQAMQMMAEQAEGFKKAYRTFQNIFEPQSPEVDLAPPAIPMPMTSNQPPVTMVPMGTGDAAPVIGMMPDGNVHWGSTIFGNVSKLGHWMKSGVDMALKMQESLERSAAQRAGYQGGYQQQNFMPAPQIQQHQQPQVIVQETPMSFMPAPPQWTQ